VLLLLNCIELGGGLAGWGRIEAAGGGAALAGQGFAGEDAAVELVDDARYVDAGFVVGRDAAVPIDGSRARVVGGESDGDVVVVAHEELVEIGGAATNVFVGTEAIVDALFGGGFRHELHEAAGAGAADGVGVAVAFGFDDAGQQVFVEVVLLSGLGEHLVEVGGA